MMGTTITPTLTSLELEVSSVTSVVVVEGMGIVLRKYRSSSKSTKYRSSSKSTSRSCVSSSK